MKELTLLADSRAPLAFHLETSAAVAHWNLRDVPGDHISLPALCDARLTEIRREHAAWACRTGLRPVEGALLHEHFQAGEKLSMWWCSLLYARHPKMTPLLYEIYKLRTLEHLLDEGLHGPASGGRRRPAVRDPAGALPGHGAAVRGLSRSQVP